MFDVITFGSATFDILINLRDFSFCKGQKRKGIFLPLNEKIEGEKIFFRSGGGGGNSAATFANQGLKVAFCGMIGRDCAGYFVSKDLNKFKIDTRFLFETEKRSTSCSVIFTGKEGKIILPYRGASRFLSIKTISLAKLRAKWFYLAPLSGFLRKDFLKIIDFAKKNHIKVALNPSKYQLAISEIKEALKKVDILILNQEEASFLTKIPFEKEKKIFERLDKLTGDICIMTKGERGATASDGKYLYHAPILRTKVIDTTGAGDAFGAGFVTQFIKTSNIILALQFATANAAAKVGKIGAKEGLLKKSEKWKKVPVKKIKIIN